MGKKRINLALQGGGAHGAFTWGVLDTLLADPDIEIAGMSGTSAGALNGAAVKAGMAVGGAEVARDNLNWLWSEVGSLGNSFMDNWLEAMSPSAPILAKAMEYSPAYAAMDMTSRLFSPYIYGPALKNPLEKLVRSFHFDEVCADAGPKLFIGATNVRSGKIRVFEGDEITPEAIMASACLPTLFQAVELEDPKTGEVEAFWDGGYTGNPALFPLFGDDLPEDIVIININPLRREALPFDTQSITNRINEISFNTSLLRELRAIDFVQRLIADGSVKKGSMKRVLIHMIADDDLMNELNVATKTIPSPVILTRLKEAGQIAAQSFLKDHKSQLNKEQTVDKVEMFS